MIRGTAQPVIPFSEIKDNQKIVYTNRDHQWVDTIVQHRSAATTPPFMILADGARLNWDAWGVETGWSLEDRAYMHPSVWLRLGWSERVMLQRELGFGEGVLEWVESLL